MTRTHDPLAEDADRILLVDDDATNLEALRHALDGRGYRLFVTRSGENAIDVARRARPGLVLLDVVMPGIDGYETCRRLKDDPETREAAVIFLSSLDDARDKVRGLEVGAVDFVSKPFQKDEVVARVNTHLTLQRLRRQLEARNAELSRELAVAQELLTDARRRVEGPLLGDSPAIRALRESMAQHAANEQLLFLTGPQGGGHEAVARAIHHASPRGRQAFIHLNCALLPVGQDPGIVSPAAALAESPAGQRLSLLELATRGTLYLEEVQRLSGDVQERLADVLHVLERPRERGGAMASDVRFIVSSSSPLATTGGFHPKLLALLEWRQLRVPSLAERQDDVAEIALFFLRQHARRIGAVVESISERSMKRLRRYRWPGDVGELQSLIERAVTSARDPVLEIDEALLDEGLPLGLYRLMEKLGEGGMGEVWRARHQLLARPCAIKLIRPELLGEKNREAATERFRLEAQHRALELTEHRAAVRLRRQRERQLLLRDGAADRDGPRVAGPAVRADGAGARRLRAAPGVPIARRSACRGTAAPRHQAAQSLPVPSRPRLRRAQGPRLRAGEVAERRHRAGDRRRHAEWNAGVHAARARHRRRCRGAVGSLLARLRRLLDANRAAGVHRRSDGGDGAPRADRAGAAVESD